MKFNTLVPEISVFSFDISKCFYIDVLGFKLEYERADDKFAFLSYEKAQLMISEIHEQGWNISKLEYPLGRGINFQIDCQNVDVISKKIKDNNIPLYKDVMVNSYINGSEIYNDKEFLVQDPNGYLLRFSERI